MDQTIQVHRRLVDLQEILIIQVIRVRTISTENHLHCLIKIGYSLSEAVQVEVVTDVVFVYFDEELVALKVAEPLNPTGTGFTIIFFIQI